MAGNPIAVFYHTFDCLLNGDYIPVIYIRVLIAIGIPIFYGFITTIVYKISTLLGYLSKNRIYS